ncbi:MAG: RdgB/HAM1 family non-canonical purine NTP pyrophosphatase [Cyanobacteriota bacterium]|nr:RdgB/HAM1 family non-canonical purine NTP pyrophosphatase [Cyanobacteriota bacterium]
MQLVVATSNPGKLKELQKYLGDCLEDSNWELVLKPQELDVEETGDTFAANARLKASEIAIATNNWAIADDSGLQVDALNGAPGVYSARYGANDSERIARLLKELGQETNRKAQFACAIAIARPDGSIALESEGVCRGEILYETRGDGGFGYDPLFFVPDSQLTFAQMSSEVKRSISHRGKALASLIPQLEKLKP